MNSCSIESLVFCDEMIGIARHFAQGIEVNAETLAEDVIHDVGPEGHFLGEEHTVTHFRESWMPEVFARTNYQKWKADGEKDLRSRCVEKVDSIVAAGPRKPRDPELLEELDAIVKACEDKNGISV